MARLGRLGFLAVGVIFHIIYIYSIFDIYFVSPIVHGMRPYRVDAPAPAKRLFLVVGDGLRADKCFQQHADPDEPATTRYLAPFVRSKVLEEGTFGVSHTRVPTESRPGHVALIAGLYEDVSAVTTGWKHNPVNFDSVFNRSRHTWSWGSPDILPMFKDGANDPDRVDAFAYGSEMEDFTQDSTQLDIWVFDRVKQLFESAKTNSTLNVMLRQDKLVFFLHLLGLDTAGHSYRPYSPEYLRNIKVVDDGLREVHTLVEDFYGKDEQTSWVFTADHGMSDWGSHGDGHPDNTRTPLVAWGAGVKKPISTKGVPEGVKTGHEDGFSGDWGLDSVRRVDVAQADVAALMAYLVGLEFPVNSVGELPLEYVDADVKTKALAAKTNARQILEMYRVKEEQKKAVQLQYKPFGPLENWEAQFAEIDALLKMGAHYLAIEKSMDLMKRGLEGIRYLQTYDWLFLRTLITLGYLGWIAFAFVTVLDVHILKGASDVKRSPQSIVFFSAVLVALYSMFIVQHARITYYPYAFFPVAFWEEVYARRGSVTKGLKQLVAGVKGGKVKLVLQTLGGMALLEAVVTGYFHREVFTVCYLLAATWPLFYGFAFVKRNAGLSSAWAVCCVLMSTFTLLPAVKTESELQILSGGAMMFGVGLLYMGFRSTPGHTITDTAASNRDLVAKIILGVQTGLIGLAMYVTSSSLRSLQAKQGLPLGNQILGWIVLAASLVVPAATSLFSATDRDGRLVSLFLTFAPTFIILTISYEGLFYVAFSALLYFWIRIEQTLPVSHLEDLRIASFFFFLLQSGFFSTGNIASISSFSLDSVYRLVSIFDPFAMGALLMYKLLVPFVLISATLGVLDRKAIFMVATAVSDVLTLNFFWMVKDEGSWLEIGSSISNFCIGGLLGVFVAVLELGASVFAGKEKGTTGVKDGKKKEGNGKALKTKMK